MSQRVRIHTSIVDFQEHTISREGVVLSVQGKVLQVLTCLMAQQGQLVSIDTLMQEVWGQTVVSPNTLQRCIAQLRKAFGETSQTQNVIKTYPKRGYALIAPVVVEEARHSTQPADSKPAARKAPAAVQTTKTGRSRRWLAGFLIFSAGLLIVALQLPDLPSSETSAPRMLQLQSQLTASAQHEDNASYSPDRRWIAFERFDSFCSSTFWLQQRADKSEVQLTHTPQQFSGSAWSPDARQLALINNHRCFVPDHTPCWQVEVIELADLAQRNTPASVRKVGACEHQPLTHPIWTQDQQLLLLRQAKHQGHRSLVQMSIKDGTQKELLSEGDILTFTMLPNQQIMAITHIGSGQSELLKVTRQGEILSRVPLQYQQLASAFNQITLHRLPPTKLQQASQQLVLESDGQLFMLQEDGALQLLPTPAGLRLSRFALNGNHAIATMGGIDLDIISSDLQANQFQTLQRSPAFESQAKLSPQGTDATQNMVFISDRSGQNQIWLAQGSALRQLSSFDTPVKFNGLVWALDGQSVLANVNDMLYQFSLDGQNRQLASPVRIKYLHQTTTSDQLLVEYQHEFQEMLALLQPATGQLTPLLSGSFDDARLDQHGTLWLTDAQFKLYQLPEGQKVAQPLLPEVTISAFTVTGDKLLATTKNGALLQLDLQSLQTQFHSLPENHNLWISDASATQILLNQKQTISTDIVEFNW